MEYQNNTIQEIIVTSHMMKNSYISRWYYYLFYIFISGVLVSFVNFFIAIILGTIITFIIFGILFGWRRSFSSHYDYQCPKCGYNMYFFIADKETKLKDVKYDSRCPKCAEYHGINYRYDGNMKILKD